MLTSIDVDSDNAFPLAIAGVTPKNSLLVRQITGLNPPARTLFIGEYSRDGGTYQGNRVGNRFLSIIMDLNPNPALGETVSGLREKLYKAFMDPLVEADYIKFTLHMSDGRTLYTTGYTETFDAETFSEESMVQIAVTCPDPYLRDDVATVLTHPTGWTTVPFTYNGTAETGFETRIQINAPTPRIVLSNNAGTYTPLPPEEDPTGQLNLDRYFKRRMVFDYDFLPGDVLVVNTVRGFRKVELMLASSGAIVPMASYLHPRSPWLQLHSQSNQLKVQGTEPTDLPAAIRSLIYISAYWGI